jgi:hypothetical protein
MTIGIRSRTLPCVAAWSWMVMLLRLNATMARRTADVDCCGWDGFT